MAESRSVVIAALLANAAIAVLKFAGFLLTGSAAMLSETYHSISDTGNQIFLLIGIRYGEKEANREHPFGYGKAQFFYSFLVSVLLFGIAGWESAKHGYDAIVHPHPPGTGAVSLLGVTFPGVWVNYAVLVGAIAFESYALKKAYTAMRRQIDDHGWSGFREAFRKTSDVTTLTALTEDTIAISGAGLALFGVFLSRITGNPLYDAVAALLIGLLLMGFAVALAWENKRLLLGESLPAVEERELRELVAGWSGVDTVVDFRTVYFGPEEVIVTGDVEFDPRFDTTSIDERISEIEDALVATNPQVQKVYIEPEV
ncbi:cation diffusion facilitator family transporter [Halococcus thailandensis]|uniref:Cation diffusion facilitator family transporter n=1 Tax=Halococcus thailandensis JCM 13552 TaxID=1227457 RepID=M0N4Q0_9EURY|nr:cation diffusion facilitator family transporter [Halococcus thailandensis]EMA52912.1 cation diffusion facilitator family transporter [Halococcus thailandensis JCM 13552]